MGGESGVMRLGSGVTVLVLLTAFGACAASGDGRPNGLPSEDAGIHLVVTAWRNGHDAMLSLQSGVLMVQSDGCVGLQVTGTNEHILLRWPAGSRIAENGQGVVGLSGKRFGFGEEAGFGGGFGLVAVPPECDSSLWQSVYDIQQPL